jgi:hypothetical protein
MSSDDALKRLEQMAAVGCTNEEIAHYFGCTLTPELQAQVERVRVFSQRQIPKPTEAEVARECQKDRYRPRWMRFL